jgi:hypothetical protein
LGPSSAFTGNAHLFRVSPSLSFVGLHGKRPKMIQTIVFLVILLGPVFASAQGVTTFEGIDASQLSHKELDFDPNGAIGTKQYMEWVNVYFQAFDKNTFARVWSAPQHGTSVWQQSGMSNCDPVGGDGIINFDRLASRWVIAARSASNSQRYFYCFAISNTDDLTSPTLAWYSYQFYLNPVLGANSKGHTYYPDWPRLGTWSDAYYVNFDLLDTDNKWQEIGVVVCAMDRSNMLKGATARPMQCFSEPDPIPTRGSLYRAHSLIPADINGTTPPPEGEDEFLVSIQNPPNDGHTTTSSSLNLWDFHVDWDRPRNSALKRSSIAVPTYTPGCYDVRYPARTQCIPEPSVNPHTKAHYHIDSVGDRFMPRLDYRSFGSYQSFLVSHTVQVAGSSNRQTSIRWYELRGSASPTLYQSGTLNPPTKYLSLFMPSIAQDKDGNAAVGYSVSSTTVHPGIKASWWSLPNSTAPKALTIKNGIGDEENSTQWGDYTSMTVDPVDECTFWYVNEYFPSNQTGKEIIWNTRIAKFRVSTCH